MRQTVGDRPLLLADRFAHAAAQLQVLGLPEGLEKAVEATDDYVQRLADHRSPELKARWPAIFKDLHAAVCELDPEGPGPLARKRTAQAPVRRV